MGARQDCRRRGALPGMSCASWQSVSDPNLNGQRPDLSTKVLKASRVRGVGAVCTARQKMDAIHHLVHNCVGSLSMDALYAHRFHVHMCVHRCLSLIRHFPFTRGPDPSARGAGASRAETRRIALQRFAFCIHAPSTPCNTIKSLVAKEK